MTKPVKVKTVKEICHDRTVRIHCIFITAGIVITITLILMLGAYGETLSAILSPMTMYGQEITDAVKHISNSR